MLTLAPPHQRRHHHKAASLRQLQHLVDYLLHALLLDELAAFRAVRFTCACEQKTQVIVYFRDRTYGRTRIAARGLLVDGNCRAQAFDVVHIRLVHLSQELAGVGRKRFHIAALAFSVNRIKGQAAFAAAAEACDNYHFIARYFYRYIFQIVLSRTLYN